MAIEEPSYVVCHRKGGYEIRKYAATVIAETTVDADFKAAGNQAFRILADYIFGNNRSSTKLEMTAPVSQSRSSEKIAMTAPVNLQKSERGFVIQFTMPRSYTLQTLPVPNDGRVRLREIPARTVAVYRYSGGWSESRYRDRLRRFLERLKKDGIATQGEPIFARFNSPFRLPFLRRNEIWLELKG